MEYMSDEDRWYILLSLMRLSEWEVIEIDRSMRWWVTISIWKEACQLEKKARKGKWEDYNEVDPIISYGVPWGCTLRDTPEIHPKSTQINPNQINPIQPKSNQYISKDILEQALDPVEKKEYGNKDINAMLWLLKKLVWCTTFSESEQWQRNYAKHMLTLWSKIGKEEFMHRLEWILSDSFKLKNCNKLKYLYKEMKAYIHSPVVPQNTKNSVFILS